MVGTLKNRIVHGGAILLTIIVIAGCTTTRNSMFVEIDEAYQQGDYATAIAKLEEENESLYRDKDSVLYYLDVGMLQHYNGDYASSRQNLSEAERLIEELFTRSVSQAAGSLLLNDNVIDYAGEDFEDVYLNVFNALNFLAVDDAEAAFVEVRRINTKLNLLEDKYRDLADQYGRGEEASVDFESGESRFYNSALARYMSLLLYRGSDDYDGARIDWEEIQEAYREQSNIYDFELPLDDSVIARPAEGNARLSVLAFAGQGPVKLAETLYVITTPNMVSILYAEESEGSEGNLIPRGYAQFPYPGVDGGYRFKFQLPRMELRGSNVQRIRVVVDGQPMGDLGLFENIEQVALDTFQIRYPLIFLKTVTRTIVKGVLAEEAKDRMQQAGEQSGSVAGLIGGFAASLATDVAVDASEQADLRMSRYFPAFAYVREIDLPPGEYQIEIEYFVAGGLSYIDDLGMVTVGEDGVNLATSYFNQ